MKEPFQFLLTGIEIAIEKRKRRALERRWRSTGLPSDYRSFVFQCDVVNSLLRSAKTSYYRDVIESSNHDQSSF